MDEREREFSLSMIAGAAAVLLMANIAIAAPPASRVFSAPAQLHGTPQLDLRPPRPSESSENTSASFPSMRLHEARFQSAGAPMQREPFGVLSAEVPAAKPMGRIEELARRVHREGVPVARLWENKSALVSLGLNGRGKPGIWLIQKVH